MALLASVTLAFVSCSDKNEGENGDITEDDDGKKDDGDKDNDGGSGNGGNNGGSGSSSSTEDVKADVYDVPDFDYATSDLSEYVNFSREDYKDYPIHLHTAGPREIDTDVAILEVLASYKGEAKNDGAIITDSVFIAPGDTVYIWYRGYTLDKDGKEENVGSMCNFGSDSAAQLSIGSGQFVPGFELNLVGVNTADYQKFVKIIEGTVSDSQIAYVSYTRIDESGKSTQGSCERIILSDTELDKTYGEGFTEKLIGATVGTTAGDFELTLNGKKYTYKNFTVNFVTECEVAPLLVECYFPYDYGLTALQNKNAYFEVYIEGVVQYECPEYNDDFVRGLITEGRVNITESKLLEYEGDTLTEKFRSFVTDLLEMSYQEELKSLKEDEMWNHYLSSAVIKKYPKQKVDPIYEEYLADVEYQFEQTGGSLYDQYTGQYVIYETLDEFAVAYLGLTYSENKDWKSTLYKMAKNLVKERLILYYLMQAEEILPTEEELAEKVESIKQEYVDEYVLQYLDYVGKTREDYTDEEYAEFLEAREKEIFDYYSDEYFLETAYYELALSEFLSWMDVTTYDDQPECGEICK